MLSREFIRNNVELVKGAIASRQDTAPIDEIFELDATQRRLKAESDSAKGERNRQSKAFGDRSLSEEQRNELRANASALRDRISELDHTIEGLETRLHELELWVPNIPDPSVPVGATE